MENRISRFQILYELCLTAIVLDLTEHSMNDFKVNFKTMRSINFISISRNLSDTNETTRRAGFNWAVKKN